MNLRYEASLVLIFLLSQISGCFWEKIAKMIDENIFMSITRI